MIVRSFVVKNDFIKAISAILIIVIACMLVFGVTRSYYQRMNENSLSDCFGTYETNAGSFAFISVSKSGDGSAPDNTGTFTKYDKHGKSIEQGKCRITKDNRVISLYCDKGTESIVVYHDGTYYINETEKEPIVLEKVSDESM